MRNHVDRILADQVRLLFSVLPIGLAATVVNSGVVAALHVGLVPRGVLLAWFSAHLVLSLVRAVTGRLARRDLADGSRVRFWGRVFVAGITASGIVWGSAATFFLFHDSVPHRILVAYVLGGMAAGAAATFAGLRLAYFGYTGPALVPQIVLFFALGGTVDLAMAGMLLFFWILVSLSAESNRRIIQSSFLLRIEREGLIDTLTKAIGETRRSNEALRIEIARRERSEELVRRARDELESKVRERTAELAAANGSLEETNRELSDFTHTVSHDLRAPLRAVSAFSEALEEDYAELLDETGRRYTAAIKGATNRMNELIEDLLVLSRVTRAELEQIPVDLTALVRRIVENFRVREPGRRTEVVVHEGIEAVCDPRLVRIALENLLDNAWKYTARTERARIEVGMRREEGRTIYYVADNGVGFDMTSAKKIFAPFQRLHSTSEYPGTGIGLATVQRVVRRHGGAVWAESVPGRGTTMYFTLAEVDAGEPEQAPGAAAGTDERADRLR